MSQQIKKKFLAPEVIDYFDNQIDSVEQNVDNLEQSKADKSYVDSEAERLEGLVSDESSARESADALIDSKVDQEISDRQAAVSAEESARIAADSALDAKIEGEESARIAGDASTLQASKDYTDEKISLVMSNLDTEALDSLVEVVEAFQNADGNINQAISDLASSASSSLSAETSAREAADSALDSKIDQEIADRESADQSLQSSIDAEQSAREAADDELQASVDAESSAREAAIANEASLREAADALKEDSANKSDDEDLGESNILFPTQKAVKTHVVNKQLDLSRKLLTGKGIDTLLPVGINVETADRHYSGGVTHAINSDHACYFTDSSLVFVDARNPFGVEIYKTITFSTASNNFPQTMVAIGNYVYMAMSNGRLYTIDWTDLQNPVIVGFVAIGSGQHYDVTTDGADTLFLANTTNNRVYIVDISNKVLPALITSIVLGGFGTGVAFNNGHLYVTNYSNKLHTITKNPDTQVWGQIAVLDTIVNPNRCRIVENSRGEKLLFAMRYNGADAAFFNISNPALPSEVKRLTAASPMQIYAVPFAHENIVHVGFTNGSIGGFSIVDVTDPKIAGSYTPVNQDGSKKFSEMRVLIKATTKSPYFKDKALLLSTGVRVGGTSTQKTTAPVQLPVINHDLIEFLSRPTSSSVSGSIASESQARIDADADLQGQIDAEKSRLDAILDASDADKDSFKEIVDLINSVDTENDQAFAGYVLSNNEAMSLKADISYVDSEISDLQDSISIEESARISADLALQSQIDSLQPRVGELESAVEALQGDKEVFEFGDISSFPEQGVPSKVYVSKDSNKLYRYEEGQESGGGLDLPSMPSAPQLNATISITSADNLQATINAASDGDVIFLANGTYSLAANLSISKQVALVGESQAGVLIQDTRGNSQSFVSVSVDNVTLKDLTVRHVTSDSSIGHAITVSGSGFPQARLNNFRMYNVKSQYSKGGLSVRSDNFVVDGCTFEVVAGSSTRRGILHYGNGGNSFIKNSHFINATTGALRAITPTSTTGTNPSDNQAGSLTIEGSTFTGNLSQFVNMDNHQGAAGSFELIIKDNVTPETNAFVVSFGAAANFGDVFSRIVMVGNTLTNNHSSGLGKGALAIDGTGGIAYRSSVLPVISTGNTLGQLLFRSGYAEAIGSTGSLVGYNSTSIIQPTVEVSEGSSSEVSAGSYIELSPTIDQDLAGLQSAINDEQARAMSVESGLDSRLTTAESDIDSLETALTSEVSRATSAEEALDARVLILENAPISLIIEDEKHSITSTLTHVMLDFKADKIFKVVVGRMNAMKGEDYVVSEEGGKTKLTWIGSFAESGVEALQAGDDVFCTYVTFESELQNEEEEGEEPTSGLINVGSWQLDHWLINAEEYSIGDGFVTRTSSDNTSGGRIYSNVQVQSGQEVSFKLNMDYQRVFLTTNPNLSLIDPDSEQYGFRYVGQGGQYAQLTYNSGVVVGKYDLPETYNSLVRMVVSASEIQVFVGEDFIGTMPRTSSSPLLVAVELDLNGSATEIQIS
jgi:hypothetical protein